MSVSELYGPLSLPSLPSNAPPSLESSLATALLDEQVARPRAHSLCSLDRSLDDGRRRLRSFLPFAKARIVSCPLQTIAEKERRSAADRRRHRPPPSLPLARSESDLRTNSLVVGPSAIEDYGAGGIATGPADTATHCRGGNSNNIHRQTRTDRRADRQRQRARNSLASSFLRSLPAHALSGSGEQRGERRRGRRKGGREGEGRVTGGSGGGT